MVVSLNRRDGNEGHSEVGDLAQDAVQGCLVDDAGEHRGAVRAGGEREAVEPGAPAAGQVALEANLVTPAVLAAHGHRLPSGWLVLGDKPEVRRRCGEPSSPHVV